MNIIPLGSFFREKRGSCPMYKVMSVSSLCEHEEAQCDTDFICDGDLKCCEDERCGVSKCTKPVIEVEKPVRSLGKNYAIFFDGFE